MKRVMKKTLVLIIFLLSFGTSWGQTIFWVDSLEYEIISDNTVKVKGVKSGITNAVIPATVTNYGNTYNVTSIGDNAFASCNSLASIEIPEGVTSIGNHAFGYCNSLVSIEIPESVTSIDDNAFGCCSSLASIEIPEGVTSIGNYTFIYCSSLASIEIPKSVTSIGGASFYGCSSLTSIEIPEGVTSIGGAAFYECSSLTSITIPDGVTKIASFEPEYEVTDTFEGAFENCTSLTSVTIGSGIDTIESQAFYGCSKLKDVTCLAEVPPTIEDETFEKTSTNKTLTVSCNAVEAYKDSDWDLHFTNIICDKPSSLNGVAGQEMEIDVYPNPIEANGNAVISLQGLNGNARLTLIDAQGRIIVSEDLISETETYEINTSNLSAGIYYLSIRTQSGIATEKLIVR